MQMQTSLYHYIALDNPSGAQQFITLRGMKPAASFEGMANQMQSIVDAEGERTFNDLKMLHPDRELFMGAAGFSNMNGGSNNFSNSCGCSGFSGANGSGQIAKSEVEKLLNEKPKSKDTDTILILGTVIIALALILNKK